MKRGRKKGARLLIGAVAHACEVEVATVLYYQRLGLLREPPKPSYGGYRVYRQSDIEQLRKIRRAQSFGFSLKEVGAILSEVENDDCGAVKARIQTRIDIMVSQIDKLEACRQELVRLMLLCNGKRKGACPLFDSPEESTHPEESLGLGDVEPICTPSGPTIL